MQVALNIFQVTVVAEKPITVHKYDLRIDQLGRSAEEEPHPEELDAALDDYMTTMGFGDVSYAASGKTLFTLSQLHALPFGEDAAREVRVGRVRFRVAATHCHGMSSLTLAAVGPYEQNVVTAVNGFVQQANARRKRRALRARAEAAAPAVVLTRKNALFGSDPGRNEHFGPAVDLMAGLER